MTRRDRARFWPALTAVFVAIAAGSNALAASFSVVHDFDVADGTVPSSELIQATDGLFYGCTSGDQAGTWGTIFRMDSLGTVTVLHTFTKTGAEGYRCNGLIQANDGLFYGTNNAGGAGASCGFFDEACGTVWRMDSVGTVTVLHTFLGADGSRPTARVIQSRDGYLVGTTFNGGDFGRGTVYRIETDGTNHTILHSFDKTDGLNPVAPLVQALNGLFYGTTNQGGSSNSGVIFRISGLGVLDILHHFDFDDGHEPKAALIEASAGYLYGTTERGSCNGNIFRIDLAGNFELVHEFNAYGSDGFRPVSPLLEAWDGSLYGTSPLSGLPPSDSNRRGCIFKMDPSGMITVLHTFVTSDGSSPSTGLLEATDGTLWGVTPVGGSNNAGVAYQIDLASGLNLVDLTFDPNPVTGASRTTGTITLDGPAPRKGPQVILYNTNPLVVTIPESVKVRSGRTTATFTVTTDSITSPKAIRIMASYLGTGVTSVLTVEPPPPVLQSIELDPTTVLGGQPSTGIATLTSVAPAGGADVMLSSSKPTVASVSSSVTIPEGAFSANFVVSTSAVKRKTRVSISGTFGVSRSAKLTVTR